MIRTLLTATLLLLLAATAHGMSPSRQGANGGGGSCPEAQADEATADAANPAAVTAQDPQSTPAATPAPAKSGAAARPKSGARWHSFLPGMFK